MKKFNVTITETLSKEVTIFAESIEEAEIKATSKYNLEEIVLDSSDFSDCTITAREI